MRNNNNNQSRDVRGKFKKHSNRVRVIASTLCVAFLGLSGLYVAHYPETVITTLRIANAGQLEGVERQSVVSETLSKFSEDEILMYLANNAKESDYVKERLELANEMLVADKVNNDLLRMQLKVQSGGLFKGKDLAKDGEGYFNRMQEDIEAQKVRLELE